LNANILEASRAGDMGGFFYDIQLLFVVLIYIWMTEE